MNEVTVPGRLGAFRTRSVHPIKPHAAMLRAIDAALAGLDGGQEERETTMEDLFQGFNASQYEDEARRRWV